jgi:hypothetical protein
LYQARGSAEKELQDKIRKLNVAGGREWAANMHFISSFDDDLSVHKG